MDVITQRRFNIILIGYSVGGLSGLFDIIEKFSSEIEVPVVVLGHASYKSKIDVNPVEVAQRHTTLRVVEANDKTVLKPGTIYISPAGYHIYIEEDETISLSLDDRVSYVRPSIDVLFESAVSTYGDSIISVLLSGSNMDGTDGAVAVKKAGGVLIVQDPKSAFSSVMIESALQKTEADYILPASKIAECIMDLQKQMREI